MIRLPEENKESGNTIIEFVLVTALVLVPLLLGGMVVGFNLIRAIQAGQVNRDSGHMYARGVDFSPTSGAGNRAVLSFMAPRLATTSGTGVVILSEFQFVGPVTCTNCNNTGHAVFLQQLSIGNPALLSSHFGTVPTASMKSDGSGLVKNPYTDTAVQADGILGAISLTDGDLAYVSETYFASADFDIAGFLSPSGVYSRAIF